MGFKKADAFPGTYLKAADLQGKEPTVVISHIQPESMQDLKTKQEVQKFVCYFQGKAAGVVLSPTKWDAIEAIYGDDTDNWIGKPVTLYTVQTQMGPGLQFKAPTGAAAAPKPAAKVINVPAAPLPDDFDNVFPASDDDIPF